MAEIVSRDVFLNAPFDRRYEPLFRAVVFAVLDSRFRPRCALEHDDGGTVRVDKLYALIGACRFGIHDLSRTQLDPRTRLPRFNMPFELGLFLGARKFGGNKHRGKQLLILDRAPYRYQKFLSDIAGQDIRSHGGRPAGAIRCVRDWLRLVSGEAVPGASVMTRRFDRFRKHLPSMCRRLRIRRGELTYADYLHLAELWITENR